MEHTKRFYFIKSFQRGEHWVAMIADAEVLASNNQTIDALRSASKQPSFNCVSIREGVHFYDAAQLAVRLAILEEQGMEKSVADHRQALKVIHQKLEAQTPAMDSRERSPRVLTS